MEEKSDLEKVREEFERWRERKIGGQVRLLVVQVIR